MFYALLVAPCRLCSAMQPPLCVRTLTRIESADVSLGGQISLGFLQCQGGGASAKAAGVTDVFSPDVMWRR